MALQRQGQAGKGWHGLWWGCRRQREVQEGRSLREALRTSGMSCRSTTIALCERKPPVAARDGVVSRLGLLWLVELLLLLRRFLLLLLFGL